MDFGLENRRVLVTGASGNIGRATAIAFGAEGATVAVGYHGNEAGAKETASEVEGRGGKAITVQIDLGETSSVQAAAQTVQQEFGGIDVLVNNAVAWPGRRPPDEAFEDLPIELVASAVQSTIVGQHVLSQAAVRSMRANGWGRVVHISTGNVEDGQPRSSAYTTPKGSLHALTRTMSRELAPVGILTNCVMSGFVPRPGTPQPVIDVASRSAAVGRSTEPQEVANLVVFLGSNANTNITGERIRVDGHFYLQI